MAASMVVLRDDMSVASRVLLMAGIMAVLKADSMA